MAYILIALAGFIWWLFDISKNGYMDFFDKIMISFLTLGCTALVVGVFCFILLGLSSAFAESSYIKTSESKIIALQDNSSAVGSFFLGSGIVEGSMQYTYMTKENEEMQMHTLKIDEATLIYSSEPRIEKYEKIFDSKVIRFLFGRQPIGDTVYKLYIPEGTVKESYNVDLK